MTRSPDHKARKQAMPEVPAPLVDYADRLLHPTGLHVKRRAADCQLDPTAPLDGIANALRAGWQLAQDPT